MSARTQKLLAPGVSLHYEVRGSGPVLLMIPGAPADAGLFEDLAGLLADRYTVVAFDLRGLSCSGLDGPPVDQRAQVQADDAQHLLAALGAEPAYVLGISGGALTGLDLAARYPGQVRTLVAHEPPAVEVLPDRERWRAFFQEVYDTYRSDGAEAAMHKVRYGHRPRRPARARAGRRPAAVRAEPRDDADDGRDGRQHRLLPRPCAAAGHRVRARRRSAAVR